VSSSIAVSVSSGMLSAARGVAGDLSLFGGSASSASGSTVGGDAAFIVSASTSGVGDYNLVNSGICVVCSGEMNVTSGSSKMADGSGGSAVVGSEASTSSSS
jgi:hypothetical protein